MIRHLSLLAVLICGALLFGCGQSEQPMSGQNRGMSSLEQEKLKRQIDSLVAGSRRRTPTDSSKVRSVCTYCGAWKESSPTNIFMSLMEGAPPGSPEAKQIAEAKKSEAPFFVRHLEQCGRKGGLIKAVYPGEPGWSILDPKKRED